MLSFTPLREIIPRAELTRLLRQDYCELEPDFLCFEPAYQAAAEFVPKDYIIVDFGCYLALQAYLFTRHRCYIGIDCLEQDSRFQNLERAKTANSLMLCARVQDLLPSLWHGSNLYVMAVAVPDIEVQEAVRRMPNHFLWYPGKPADVQGVYAKEIQDAFKDYIKE